MQGAGNIGLVCDRTFAAYAVFIKAKDVIRATERQGVQCAARIIFNPDKRIVRCVERSWEGSL